LRNMGETTFGWGFTAEPISGDVYEKHSCFFCHCLNFTFKN